MNPGLNILGARPKKWLVWCLSAARIIMACNGKTDRTDLSWKALFMNCWTNILIVGIRDNPPLKRSYSELSEMRAPSRPNGMTICKNPSSNELRARTKAYRPSKWSSLSKCVSSFVKVWYFWKEKRTFLIVLSDLSDNWYAADMKPFFGGTFSSTDKQLSGCFRTNVIYRSRLL